MERLAHIATVSGVQFVNERARRPFESAWRLSSTGLLEAFRLIFGLLAQLVEHSTVNRRAIGSSPIQAASPILSPIADEMERREYSNNMGVGTTLVPFICWISSEVERRTCNAQVEVSESSSSSTLLTIAAHG